MAERSVTAKSGIADPALAPMALAALGIVFGDIGTSPLYTLRTVLNFAGAGPVPAVILGSLSLIIWTLIAITSVKYVAVAMRIDNDGEGDVLALMSLLFGDKRRSRPIILAAGLFGAALILGDGAIAPAISVLSALEGLDILTPRVQPYVLPACVAILVMLFAVQARGTAWIGKLFGPIMAAWFVIIAGLGIGGILQHPAVLLAVNPLYGLRYLLNGGGSAFLVLGGVFLCVTGAEALYADMGHFGARPIRWAWSGAVLPALVLNYAGQAAIVLAGTPTSDSVFFRLCPLPLLIPLVVLATIATIIASQSIITGAFSMTRQAMQLGWMPRLRIVQTSESGYGQIYVGTVNWVLMFVTVALALWFGKSENMAAAYGIAVSATMLITSGLLFIALRELWHWGLLRSSLVAGTFFVIDAVFFAANLGKIGDGGYVSLVLAALIYGVMVIWHTGNQAVTRRLRECIVPVDGFLQGLADRNIARVPGTAVFMTRTLQDAPPVMVWHVRHNRALHEKVFVITATTASIPWVGADERMVVTQIAPNFWRASVRHGFMERPDIPALLAQAHAGGCSIHLTDVTYYVGHETLVASQDGKGLPRWVEALYAAMQRNATQVTEYFHLPPDQVVEIGREISI